MYKYYKNYKPKVFGDTKLTFRELVKVLKCVDERIKRVFVIRKNAGYELYIYQTTASIALSLGYSVVTYNRDADGIFQRNFA